MVSVVLVGLLCMCLVPLAPGAAAAEQDWVLEGQTPGERSSFVSTELPDGRIFVALGYNSTAAEHRSDAWMFDPADMSWTQLADAPVATESSTGAYANGKVYIFGGKMPSTNLDHVLIYDLLGEEWSYGPELPNKGTFMRCLAVDDERILVVGGGEDYEKVYMFRTDTLAFEIRSDLPGGRAGGAMVLAEGVVRYFGGWNTGLSGTREIASYSVSGDYWWVSGELPFSRIGMTPMLGSDGMVYLLGGCVSFGWYTSSLDVAAAYDLYTGQVVDLPNVPEAFKYGAAFEMPDGRIMYFGGHSGNEAGTAINSLQIWQVEATLSADTVGQGGSVWLGVTLNTIYAPDDGWYGTAYLTAMGVTYAVYDISAMGSMAYLEIAVAEGLPPLGYVLELSGVGANYLQDFQIEAMELTVTEAPSQDDRMDDLEQQNQDLQDRLDEMQEDLDAANADLKEAVDAKMDAMIGYVILILVIITLVVGVIMLVRKK